MRKVYIQDPKVRQRLFRSCSPAQSAPDDEDNVPMYPLPGSRRDNEYQYRYDV